MNPILTYKNKVASRYIPVDAEQIGMKVAESEFYMASVKYDGFFGMLQVEKGKAVLYGRDGKEISIPAITNAASAIKKDVLLAGEICCFKDGKSTSHRDVSSAIAKPEKHDLRFGAFDLVELDGKEIPECLKENYELIKTFAANEKVFTIEQHIFESRKDIINFYKEAIENNEEGVVVKSSSGVIYKIKPVINLDLVVLGYAESTGENEGKLRELLLGVTTDEGALQIVTKCGNGFSQKDREDFIKKLEPMEVQSEYTEVSGAKTAFVMIKPTLVAEISCLDLINETTKGAIRKMHLSYDEKNGYQCKGQRSTFSCISPVFKRFRSDKSANAKDTGEQQALALLPKVRATQTDEELKPSEITKKRIFTKSGKSGTAIRKFSILKTNKEKTGIYPPFVVMYTDFSAGRKTPVSQDLYLCDDEKEAMIKMEECIEENVKKGWKEYAA